MRPVEEKGKVSLMNTYPAVPGVPAAGHVTSGGAWHPGRAEGCPKCEPTPTTVAVRHHPRCPRATDRRPQTPCRCPRCYCGRRIYTDDAFCAEHD